MGKPGHGRSEWDGSWQHFVQHIQTAPGRLPVALRREIFRATRGRDGRAADQTATDDVDRVEVPDKLAAFAEAVATRSDEVTDDQVAELRGDGYSEDEIFETIVVAAVGAASTHLDAARRAMEGA